MIDDTFDRLEVGASKLSRGRTVTETDVVNFCMLTGNWLELHSNEEFAKQTRFGTRVVQGTLVFSIVTSLFSFDPDLIEAFYGVDKLRFLAPTFIGDTLYSNVTIKELREKNDSTGVVVVAVEGKNQRSETVMVCEFCLLVRKEKR